MKSFQEIIQILQLFWAEQGCLVLQPLDLEMGAGTFQPASFLRAIGPEPWAAAYVQPCRRPTDGRYGENSNRAQHYYQFQVVIKPSPDNIQELYLESLKALGVDPLSDDIRFVEDNWESPTLGAWGLGWEVWQNGMEVSQFTYFQQAGGLECNPVMGELTYGLERLAMYLQNKESIFDIIWAKTSFGTVTYGDLFLQNEQEMSAYNFEYADIEQLFGFFDYYEKESKRLLALNLIIPAYEMVIKASHSFNLLDARHAISVTERQRYILRIRTLARDIAKAYYLSREQQGFPLLKNLKKSHQMPEKTADLLFELGIEELPASVVEKFPQMFCDALTAELFAQNIQFEKMTPFATPRRIAILIEDLQTQQPDRTIEKKGPTLNQAFNEDGSLTKIGEGFARSCNLNEKQIQELKAQSTERLIFQQFQPGETTKSLLPKVLTNSLKKALTTFGGRTMYWGICQEPFIRPVHWITVIFGTEKIEGKLFGREFVHYTYGHRFLAPHKIDITSPKDYEKILFDKGSVVANFATRRQIITNEINRLADENNSKPLLDDGLLEEVTGLVEWPVALVGNFDESFLTVPQEALTTSMRVNQKCFPLIDEHGKILSKFIMISNINSLDPGRVIAGNEKVVRARLSDAKFFFDQDKKQPLVSHLENLKKVIFQVELGSLYDKTHRLRQISILLAEKLNAQKELVERTAKLAKCDLSTLMVGEFPNLQGIMGKYYAWNDKEPQEVCFAIEEHYLPRFANDKLPETPAGQVVALADRIDTLLGLFGINKQPTGDKDPFALRRAAQGIVRICVEERLSFDLLEILQKSFLLFSELNLANPLVVTEVWQFIIERQRAWYADRGINNAIFNAVLAVNCSNFVEFDQRVLAVKYFVTLPEATSLAAANKRVSNLLQKQNDDESATKEIEITLLELPQEIALATALQEKEMALKPFFEQGDFTQALKSLSELQKPIDDFFDNVMVMVDNNSLKINRLRILNKARELFLQIADISQLSVG